MCQEKMIMKSFHLKFRKNFTANAAKTSLHQRRKNQEIDIFRVSQKSISVCKITKILL